MTTTTLRQLQAVRAGLQPLAFDPAQDRFEKSDCEAEYLDYYGLSFGDELPGLKHFLGFFEANSFQIASHYWLPEGEIKGTVFVIHGYFDHIGLYGHLIRHLLEKNYAVVAFDLPGHGISSGERVTIETFDHYVDVFSELLHRCETCLPRPWHGVGQSTGGAILLKYIMAAKPEHYANPIDKAVLLAPLIHPVGWKANLCLYRLVHRFVKKMKRKFLPNSGDDQFLHFVSTCDPLQERYIATEWVGAMKRWTEEFAALPKCDFPVQVIQGDRDKTVDWRYNLKAIGEKLPNVRISMIEGAQHHLVNEEESLRSQIFNNLNV